jgi:NAD(P)-dependent dehydrogenase (short-subunit alcohol dehydrogenase family)
MGGHRDAPGNVSLRDEVSRTISPREGIEKAWNLDAPDLGFTLRASRPTALYSAEQTQRQENDMARIFITGSSDGLGLMAGQLLADQGHKVVLHARSDARAADAKKALPKAEAVVVGDLGAIAATKDVAARVNALGSFDAIIHNAAVGHRQSQHMTSDNLPHVFAINTLAPYVLSALIERPKRLVYLSSGMHEHANANLDDILWRKRSWDGSSAYSESKLHDAMLAFAIARLWPDVLSNAVSPGWVATKMGGAGAPDDLDQGHLTQAWLATSDEAAAQTTGGYFYHLKPREPNPEARESALQDRLIDICREISGVDLPRS